MILCFSSPVRMRCWRRISFSIISRIKRLTHALITLVNIAVVNSSKTLFRWTILSVSDDAVTVVAMYLSIH